MFNRNRRFENAMAAYDKAAHIVPKAAPNYSNIINQLHNLFEGCVDKADAFAMLSIKRNTVLGDIADIKWSEWTKNFETA